MGEPLSGESLSMYPTEYYANSRPEVTRFLPEVGPRVLDVGCGRGFASSSLRSRGAEHLTGVEYDAESAQDARSRLDEVHHGDIGHVLPTLPDATFDLVLAYDVLEHLVDPYATLRDLRRVIRPDGRLHVSVPNARSLILLTNLIVRGTFGYDPRGGLCDATHLRWFTRRDMVAALTEAGWRCEAVEFRLGTWGRLANVASLGIMRDFIVGQYYYRARPR